MYDSLMESEERRERLRRRNQRDRDRRAAESAQQREARLTRQRVRDRIEPIVLCGLLPSGRVLVHRSLTAIDSRPGFYACARPGLAFAVPLALSTHFTISEIGQTDGIDSMWDKHEQVMSAL